MIRDHLGLQNTFVQRYGDDCWKWRPYGQQTIKEILDVVAKTLSDDEGIELRFERTGDEFRSADFKVVKDVARALARDIALIVVDPFSLYDPALLHRFRLLIPCFKSSTNAFAVLAPRSEDDNELNMVLEAHAAELYRSFFVPPIHSNDVLPSVGLHVRNSKELVRVLLLALGRKERPIAQGELNSKISPNRD